MAGGACTECAKNKNGLQRKLAIGASNDPLEQEADRVADQVMAATSHSAMSGSPPRIQRFSEQSNGQMDTVPASVDRVLAGSGKPLEPALRQDMEQRFGHDFSRVRVHTDALAVESAGAVNALAYTVGEHVVFGHNQLAPHMPGGQRLLAHELTHVVQQRCAETPGLLRKLAGVLQRQEADSEEAVNAEPTAAGPTAPPEFGDSAAPEGACPRVPTNLGALRPDPPCPTADVDINGDLFHFCTDSDVFASETERSRLRGFARRQRADATFTVHGYSSREGGDTYNLNALRASCRTLVCLRSNCKLLRADAHASSGRPGRRTEWLWWVSTRPLRQRFLKKAAPRNKWSPRRWLICKAVGIALLQMPMFLAGRVGASPALQRCCGARLF
jgi:outer membrane protein OmpA-like peptidoglycan-associated protein